MRIWNLWPPSLWKCFMARYIRSTHLNREYLHSLGWGVFERNPIGRSWPLTWCCRTAPTAVSEASTIMLVGTSKHECEREEAVAKAALHFSNAARVVSVHSIYLLVFIRSSKCLRKSTTRIEILLPQLWISRGSVFYFFLIGKHSANIHHNWG